MEPGFQILYAIVGVGGLFICWRVSKGLKEIENSYKRRDDK